MKWGILQQRIVTKIFTQQLNEPWTPKDCYDLKVVSRFCLVLLWPVLILATDDSSGRLQDSTEVSDGIILFANVFHFRITSSTQDHLKLTQLTLSKIVLKFVLRFLAVDR